MTARVRSLTPESRVGDLRSDGERIRPRTPRPRPPDPEARSRAAEAFRNWGRWGEDDVLGTLNFIDAAKRVDAAALVREGRVVSLSQSFDTNGPQKGWRRRTNPVHTMTDTGVDAERGNQGFPHGIGGADDVISMPLQCSTQWDGLGHIFDHGMAWNGRRAGDVVTSEGDLVTGIEHAASVIVSRGVLLDVGRHLQPETGELPDGYAITVADLEATIAAQGATQRRRPRRHRARAHRPARPRSPGRLGRLRRRTGARPELSRRPDGCIAPRSRRSPPTRGASRCDPTSSTRRRSSRCTRSSSRTSDSRSARCGTSTSSATSCAELGRFDFLLSAAPLPITGAVGSPINPVAIL